MTSSPIWTLIRLRYRLFGAQSRTPLGRWLLVFALGVVGLGMGIFLGYGRYALGAFILDRVRQGSILEALLTLMTVIYLGLSVLLGLGPRAAFSDAALRRYPLTAWGRFSARHAVGLLDPLWPLMALNVIGLAATVSEAPLAVGLPTALVYVALTYLAAMTALVLLDVVLLHPFGTVVLGAGLIAVMSVAARASLIFFQLLTGRMPPAWDYLPPAATATILISDDLSAQLTAVLILAAWLVGLLLALTVLERLVGRLTSTSGGDRFSNWLARTAARPFGRSSAPMVEKAFQYLLRSNRIRLGLISAVLYVVWIGPLDAEGVAPPGSAFTFALFGFFTIALVAAHPLSFNHFAYDGVGIRRYATLTVRFSEALRAANSACLLLSLVTVMVALIVWTVVQRSTGAELVMLGATALSGVFLAHGIGAWCSLVAPRASNPGSVSGALSWVGNAIFLGLFALALLATTVVILSGRAEALVAAWLAFPLVTLATLLFYLAMLESAAHHADRRREHLMQSIADTSSM